MAPLNLASPISVAAHTAHINTHQAGINDQTTHLNYIVPVVPTPAMPMDKRQFMLLTRSPHWFSRTNLIQISRHGFFREGTSEEAVKASYEAHYNTYTAANAPPAAASAVSDTASINSESSSANTLVDETAQSVQNASDPPTKEPVSAAAKHVEDEQECGADNVSETRDEEDIGPATSVLPTPALLERNQFTEQRLRRTRRGMFGKVKRFISRLTAGRC